MSAPSASARVARLRQSDAERLERQLEQDSARFGGALANQHLLDALDHGEHGRFLVWPEEDPRAVAYLASHGTVVAAGSGSGGEALAGPVDRSGWRVLIGGREVCEGILEASGRGFLRRRPHAREQRFMVAVEASELREPGLRRATGADLDALTEFAARLHVEDQMGPPLGRSGVAAVRSRMLESVSRGASWIVDRAGTPVAKLDVSLNNPRRGAQVAGVYVDASHRGQGVGTRAVADVTARLLDAGLPGVTLHVRADNLAGRAAYERAGYRQEATWLLALR